MSSNAIISELTMPKLTASTQALFPQELQHFLVALARRFEVPRQQLLAARQARQANYDAGHLPDFDPQTLALRQADWQIAALPADLQQRRLEITGPVDRKMMINALNADVDCFMADFEDSQAPTWQGLLQGQQNLIDANLGSIAYTDPHSGKDYRLQRHDVQLIVRVRGLHLPERHLQVDGQVCSGALFDFALYLFHNYRLRQQKGSGLYLYLPKLEHGSEAAWWAEVFCFSEDYFALPRGFIRATVLIETLPAVFQMDEILHAMRQHIVALNCGRWDYIFSYIKTLRAHAAFVLPDRQQVTMTQPFLRAYSRRLVYTCHRRGALAMGGMAALIPSKDPAANATILAKVKADKILERDNGHDGTWIAHPGLAATVREVFVSGLAGPNQLHVLPSDAASISASDLLSPCSGSRTAAGLRGNLRVALQYLAAWLNGLGCVAIDGLMEDAATAEIARTSIWQWIRHQQRLDDGTLVDAALVQQWLQQEAAQLQQQGHHPHWQAAHLQRAHSLLEQLLCAPELTDFLTLPSYPYLDEGIVS